MKHTLTLDLEVYKDYFLAQFKRIDNGRVLAFEKYDGCELDIKPIRMIMQTYRVITFNGMDYDLPMLCYAMIGASNEELKAASDAIILENLRGWQFEQRYGVRVPQNWDHIDLKEPVPGVKISLKLYGARLHSRKLQDLPYDPSDSITPAMREELKRYCENDLDTTADLLAEATKPSDNIIETREKLSKEFGIDLRSKSDAQIAEVAIKSRVSALKGEPVYRQDIKPGTRYKYLPPPFMKFQSQIMRDVFKVVCDSDFVVNADGSVDTPAAMARLKVSIGSSIYTMGIGGLHSTEETVAHIASAGVLLRDRDVVSYYPSLILQCGLFPENMGKLFQQVYKDFFDRRIAAKKAGDKSTAQTLKIVLNGAYGKLGSSFSVLYAPNLMIQVTITGQLALLMLIERMEAAGIPVVSANTDGIVMACPARLEPKMLEIVAQWERDTGLETEETQYTALYSRDVNNYLAIKPDGKVKTKGVLTASDAQHNPTNEIVKQAVILQLSKGIPIGQTILGCRDVRQFLRVARVTGGAQLPLNTRALDNWERDGDKWVQTHNGKTYKEKRKSRPAPVIVTDEATYLGKVVRFYRSTKSRTHIEYVSNGNKVGNSDNAMPLMTLDGSFPDDIDYGFYLKEANDLLREIGAM